MLILMYVLFILKFLLGYSVIIYNYYDDVALLARLLDKMPNILSYSVPAKY